MKWDSKIKIFAVLTVMVFVMTGCGIIQTDAAEDITRDAETSTIDFAALK